MAIDNHKAGTRENAADRRVKALELRKRGASFRAIGKELGISEAQAHRDVMAMLTQLAELERETAEEYRMMELARLDLALMALAPRLSMGTPEVVNAWVRVSESRRKLLGLDKPTLTALTNPDGTPYEAQAQLIGVVLNLLAPYPDLRLALAAQLEAGDDVQETTRDGA